MVIGVGIDGGMAEECIVPESSIVALPSGLSPRDACLVEPLAVAVHGIRRGDVRAAEQVAIVGGGAIGLCGGRGGGRGRRTRRSRRTARRAARRRSTVGRGHRRRRRRERVRRRDRRCGHDRVVAAMHPSRQARGAHDPARDLLGRHADPRVRSLHEGDQHHPRRAVQPAGPLARCRRRRDHSRRQPARRPVTDHAPVSRSTRPPKHLPSLPIGRQERSRSCSSHSPPVYRRR